MQVWSDGESSEWRAKQNTTVHTVYKDRTQTGLKNKQRGVRIKIKWSRT